MTDRIKQVQPMVYYSRWKTNMDLEIIASDSDYISQLADQNGEAYYNIIVDMTDSVSFSMDIKGLTSIAKADPRIIGFVFIKGDNTAKFIGRILKQLSKHDFEFVDTYEEAMSYSQNLLAQQV